MPRYVPKTYNNRRALRIILGAFIALALSVVILFLVLFFILDNYVIDGQLEIPWLDGDTVPAVTSEPPVDPAGQPEDAPELSAD